MRGWLVAVLSLWVLAVPCGVLAQGWTVHQRLGGGASDAVSCLASDEVPQIFTSLCVSVGCELGEAPSFAFGLQQVALPHQTRMEVAVDGRPVADLTFAVASGNTGGAVPLEGQEALVEALRTGAVARFGIEALDGRRDYELPLAGARAAIDDALASCSAFGSQEVAGDPPLVSVDDDPASRAVAENEAFCLGEGGIATVEPGFVRQADVDGDGVNDALIDWGGLACDGRRDFCGTGGCTQEVWLGDRSGPYRMILSDLILRIDLPEPGRIHLTLDGGACGRSGAEICEQDYRVENGTLVPVP